MIEINAFSGRRKPDEVITPKQTTVLFRLPETGGQPEVGICRNQAGVNRRAEFRRRPRARAGLQSRVAETQTCLPVARIVADDRLECRHERRACQLARRHLRDPRGDLTPILRIRPAAAFVTSRAAAVPERSKTLRCRGFGRRVGTEPSRRVPVDAIVETM